MVAHPKTDSRRVSKEAWSIQVSSSSFLEDCIGKSKESGKSNKVKCSSQRNVVLKTTVKSALLRWIRARSYKVLCDGAEGGTVSWKIRHSRIYCPVTLFLTEFAYYHYV